MSKFTTPDSVSASPNRWFRYRLLGFEEHDQWEEVGTRRTAYYPKIPYGNYRFEVIAANADGNWSEEVAGFEIIVRPPFYRTWWFYILLAIVFFSVIYSAYFFRKRQFVRDKLLRENYARQLLNAQELERRRIAAEIHDNLGQQLLIIKNWANYCLSKTSKTSKIRQQITQISDTADEALDTVRLMAKNLSPYHLDKAGLTATIHFMVVQVAESDSIEFVTEIENVDNLLPKEAEINLYRIVQESVNNIVKHSQATEAKVALKREADKLFLKITDNGIGFHEASYQQFGTGLNGMTERARMLGSELLVKSVPQQGTQIILEIPV